MGRDTKIGLLVGVSFILLFGIIVHKRSAEVDQLVDPGSTEVTLREDLVQPAAPQPEPGLTRTPPREAGAETLVVGSELAVSPVEETPPEPVAPLAHVESGETAWGVPPPSPTPGLTTGPELPSTVPVDPTRVPGLDSGLSFARANLSPPPPTAPVVSADVSMVVPPPTTTGRGDGTLLAVTGRGTGVTGAPPAGTVTVTVVEPGSAGGAVVVGKTYVVQSGDNFSRISRKHYGDAKYWKRIFDANKQVVSDPNLLRPGQKLVIPKLATARPAPAVATPTPRNPTPAPTAPSPPRAPTPALAAGPVYKVQSGDNLTRIAERVLKDGSRAMAIYELNKDRLKNPDSLPVGVVLRLPVQVPAARIAATPAARR